MCFIALYDLLALLPACSIDCAFSSSSVDKEDEMTCLIKGCNFVLKNIPHEAFVYVKHADPEFRFQTTHPNIFPYLLVNIGSGVSIVKVSFICICSKCINVPCIATVIYF